MIWLSFYFLNINSQFYYYYFIVYHHIIHSYFMKFSENCYKSYILEQSNISTWYAYLKHKKEKWDIRTHKEKWNITTFLCKLVVIQEKLFGFRANLDSFQLMDHLLVSTTDKCIIHCNFLFRNSLCVDFAQNGR